MIRRPWRSKTQRSLPVEPKMQVQRTKTTTIKSETHEVFVVTRRDQHSIRMWCDECANEVDMLKPEEAAALANVTTRTIYRWIEAALIQHQESIEGNVVVCPAHIVNNNTLELRGATFKLEEQS